MQYRKIPVELQRRVLSYYEFLWSENKALNEDEIFNDLPVSLRTEVALHLNSEVLESVPFFQGADTGFLHTIVTMLKPQVFCPGDTVIRRGEIGHEMFFISKGVMEILAEDDVTPVHCHGAGGFFGEVALLFGKKRTATVRAKTHCDVFVLTKKDLDHALDFYPEFSEKLFEVGRQRYESVTGQQNKTPSSWKPAADLDNVPNPEKL